MRLYTVNDGFMVDWWIAGQISVCLASRLISISFSIDYFSSNFNSRRLFFVYLYAYSKEIRGKFLIVIRTWIFVHSIRVTFYAQ